LSTERHTVQGSCDARFLAVRETLQTAFDDADESGASLHVMIGGTPVVHLWGGTRDRLGQLPWVEGTRCVVFSVTKGITALAAHMLIARGKLELDAPVSRYWPAFGNAGKADITIRQALTHTSGLAAIRREVMPGDFYDWERMVGHIEDAAPFFRPGTTQAYQMFTFGWILGELVQRVSGMSLSDYVRHEIAGPCQSNFEIGLSSVDRSVFADLRVTPPGRRDMLTPFFAEVAANPDGISALAMSNTGGHMEMADSDAALQATLGASGGVANGRDIARIYAGLASLDAAEAQFGLRAIDLERMGRTESAAPIDATLQGPVRFSCGFMTSTDNRHRGLNGAYEMRIGRNAFGMPGFGGNIGFCDRDHRLAFGYVTAKVRNTVLLNETSQRLVDSVYRCLGCSSDEAGFWS
jgi:CubicO group peptidase (beta-lactamase class C family)